LRFTRKGEGVPKLANQQVTWQCQGDVGTMPLHPRKAKLYRLRKGYHPDTGKWMAPVIRADLAGLMDPAVQYDLGEMTPGKAPRNVTMRKGHKNLAVL